MKQGVTKKNVEQRKVEGRRTGEVKQHKKKTSNYASVNHASQGAPRHPISDSTLAA